MLLLIERITKVWFILIRIPVTGLNRFHNRLPPISIIFLQDCRQGSILKGARLQDHGP